MSTQPFKESFFESVLSATFWVAATAGFAAAAAHSALPFGHESLTSWASLMKACDANPLATVFVIAWTTMVLATLSSIVRRACGVRGTWGASVVLTIASLLSLAERFSTGELTSFDADRGAVFMVAAALAFAGSSRLWWMVLGPMLAGAAIAPLAWLEFWEAATSAALVRAAGPVVIATCFASIVVVIRETRARIVEARAGIKEVTVREEIVARTLVQFSKAIAQSGGTLVTPAPESSLGEAIEATAEGVRPEDILAASAQTTTVEIEAPASAQAPSSSVTYQDLQALASETLEAVRAKWVNRPGVRLLLTAPADLSLPIAVRGSHDELRIWLRSLVENAVDALGGGRGVVRLSLKPNLTHVAISIEDNGRGLGEDLYKKLGIEDPARLGLEDVKQQASKQGARLELNSRLGVGTRATLELSRVDALSSLTRASREGATRVPTVALHRTNPDSSSMLA